MIEGVPRPPPAVTVAWTEVSLTVTPAEGPFVVRTTSLTTLVTVTTTETEITTRPNERPRTRPTIPGEVVEWALTSLGPLL